MINKQINLFRLIMLKKSNEKELPEPVLGLHSVKSVFKKLFSNLKLTGGKSKISKEDFEKNLAKFLSKNANFFSTSEKFIFENIFKFGSKTASQIMIPRSYICAIDINSSLDKLIEIVKENEHTRTLIYNENLDNIEGFIHIKDLFNLVVSSKNNTKNIKHILRKPVIAAPSTKVIDLFAEMQKLRTHICVVVDEYGGTDGLVTIEDIVEEIFGNIYDEHDTESEENENIKQISDTELITSGTVDIKDIENILNVNLDYDKDEIETIGGLVLSISGYIPKPGYKILINDKIEVKIVESSARLIKKLKIRLLR